MPIKMRMTAHGIENIIRELSGIQERISDMTPFWRTIAVPIIQNSLEEIFLSEGPGWSPLAPSTIRSRKYPGLPILQQTGNLKASILDHPTLQVSQRQLLYGTSNPYAQFHEDGTYRMPARPFLRPARAKAMEQIRVQFRNYINRVI